MPDMATKQFRASVQGGELAGWVRGSGPRLLLLHGGPGLSFNYLEPLADEIGDDYEIASYQQRGLDPSTARGPYDIPTYVDDVANVLDALGWDKATLVGHSWGGHLVVHVAHRLADRVERVLSIDPLGVVGDGGQQQFDETIFARTPEDNRARAQALDEAALRGEATENQLVEGLQLIWPAYFPTWDSAPPMLDMTGSVEAYSATYESIKALQPEIEAALSSIDVQIGFIACDRSPMPVSAVTQSAARIPGAWVEVIEGAGHFPWYDVPGACRRVLDRLMESS